MEIKLQIGNKEKTFVAGRPKARAVRDAIKLAKTLDPKNISEATLDEMVDFTVDTYGKQFTRDDVYDGIYADEMIEVLTKTVREVANGTSKKVESKNDQAGTVAENC